MKINQDKIRKKIDSIINPEKKNGSVLVSINNEIIYNRCFGFSDFRINTPVSENTQFLVGSVTKQFSALALLKVLLDKNISSESRDRTAEKINFKLQSTIDYYLPSSHEIWDGYMPGWAKYVTLHNLLTHSSGIINYTSLEGCENKKFHKSSDLVSFFKTHELEFQPGEGFSYTNSGYYLLGPIIQQIAGQAFNIYLENSFFKPLMMGSTFLPVMGTVDDLIRSDTRFKCLARGYEYNVTEKDATLKEVVRYEPMENPGAAGALVSTPEDLLRWNNALYSGEIIPESLLRLFLNPYLVTECTDAYYGYGIEIIHSEHLGSYYSHGGGIPGFRSRLTYIPSLKMSIIIVQNTAGDAKELIPEIDKIKSSLPQSLSKEEIWAETKRIIEKNNPILNENKNIYELLSVHDEIVKMLEGLIEI